MPSGVAKMKFSPWLVVVAEFLLSVIIIGMLCGKINAEKTRADEAQFLAKERQQTIDDFTIRQREVAALDAKYTKELADAQAKLVAFSGVLVLVCVGCASTQHVQRVI